MFVVGRALFTSFFLDTLELKSSIMVGAGSSAAAGTALLFRRAITEPARLI